jgi:hypothetical protein
MRDHPQSRRDRIWLYGHTKYLGPEVVRLFAERYDLEVPALLFSVFVDPALTRPQPIHAGIPTGTGAVASGRAPLSSAVARSPAL